MPGASFSNKKKAWQASPAKGGLPGSSSDAEADAGRDRSRLKVQVEIEFVIELSTHTYTETHTGRLVLARFVSCAPESVLCFLLSQRKRRSAQAYVSIMLRRQAAATGSSNKLLLSMLADTLTSTLSLLPSLGNMTATVVTWSEQAVL